MANLPSTQEEINRKDVRYLFENKNTVELQTYLKDNGVSYSWLIVNHEELVNSTVSIYNEKLAKEELYKSITC